MAEGAGSALRARPLHASLPALNGEGRLPKILTQDAAGALFARYLDCWNRRDLEGVAACFAEPAMFVLPAGAVALPDRAALVSMLKTLFEGLEAAGFDRTTVGAVSARDCGAGLAVVDVADVCRLKADGSLLERIDGHYVMRQADGGWEFVVAVACAAGWRAD